MALCSCCLPSRRGVLAGFGAAWVGMSIPGPGQAAPPTPPPVASVPPSAPQLALDDWLTRHPRIAGAMVWDGKPLAKWPEPMVRDLHAAFDRYTTGKPSGLANPPPNQLALKDTDIWQTALTPADARALYLHTVAFSLAVEIGRRVPWSLVDYTPEQLFELFDSRSQVVRLERPELYLVADSNSPRGSRADGLPPPPELAFAFLRDQGLIGRDRAQTIVKLIDWSRRLSHMGGGQQTLNAAHLWGTRGLPVISRVLTGTVDASEQRPEWKDKLYHYVAGCHGNVAFQRAVLRTVNIPVRRVNAPAWLTSGSIGIHSTMAYLTEGLYLSHGDDPYDLLVRLKPSFPVERLLFDQAQFQRWFPANAPPRSLLETNVARQPLELALDHADSCIVTLGRRARDLQAGKRREDGELFETFRERYTFEQVERRGLWSRVDDGLARMGGLQKVIDRLDTANADYETLRQVPVRL